MLVDSGTNTAGALQQAATTLYDRGQGARSEAKKVAVLVTDGHSNSYDATVNAAAALKVSVMIRIKIRISCLSGSREPCAGDD
jgi:hypothetical protein